MSKNDGNRRPNRSTPEQRARRMQQILFVTLALIVIASMLLSLTIR